MKNQETARFLQIKTREWAQLKWWATSWYARRGNRALLAKPVDDSATAHSNATTAATQLSSKIKASRNPPLPPNHRRDYRHREQFVKAPRHGPLHPCPSATLATRYHSVEAMSERPSASSALAATAEMNPAIRPMPPPGGQSSSGRNRNTNPRKRPAPAGSAHNTRARRRRRQKGQPITLDRVQVNQAPGVTQHHFPHPNPPAPGVQQHLPAAPLTAPPQALPQYPHAPAQLYPLPYQPNQPSYPPGMSHDPPRRSSYPPAGSQYPPYQPPYPLGQPPPTHHERFILPPLPGQPQPFFPAPSASAKNTNASTSTPNALHTEQPRIHTSLARNSSGSNDNRPPPSYRPIAPAPKGTENAHKTPADHASHNAPQKEQVGFHLNPHRRVPFDAIPMSLPKNDPKAKKLEQFYAKYHGLPR